MGLVTVGLFLLCLIVLLATDYHRSRPMAVTVSAMGALTFGGFIWGACAMYSVELFPTVLRNMGNAVCNSSARIGAMLAPQVLLLDFLWKPGPTLLFFLLLIINFVLVFLLMPETKGKPLPDLKDNDEE